MLFAGILAGCAETPPATPVVAEPPSWPALGEPSAAPLADGPLAWTTSDYDLGKTKVGGPDEGHEGYEYDARIRGTLTMPEGPGPFPLAVFLHGQHGIGTEADPYRNDQGYLYLMEYLASHGIATASILTYEINRLNGAGDVGMWARGELVLATVDALQSSEHAPRLDFTTLGLMGHSRGGEGVVTAAEVNAGRADPYELSAIIALAPTDFAYRGVPGIPFLTLAPYCDGDVYNLHGLRQFDQSRRLDDDAVKVQLLVMGANHNNYNTMWGGDWTTPVTSSGDDAPFGSHLYPECDLRREDGGGRLSLEETYAESKLHLGGFLRWTLLGDDSLAPYFLGAPQPPEACPGAAACPGAVHVSAMTPGRRDLFWAEDGAMQAAGGATISESPVCRMTECAGNVYSSATMANLRLLAGPATLRFAFAEPTDVRDTPVLQVRVGVPTDGGINSFGPPRMTIAFTDANGTHSVAVDDPALFLPPSLPIDPAAAVPASIIFGGPGSGKVAANSIVLRIPDDVDAASLSAIELTFLGAAPQGDQALPDRILVADAWLNRETSAVRTPAALQ